MMHSEAFGVNMQEIAEIDDYVFVDDNMQVSIVESESYDYCEDDLSERSSCAKAGPSLYAPFPGSYESKVPHEVNFAMPSAAATDAASEVCFHLMKWSDNSQVHDWTSNHTQKESMSILSDNLLESLVPNESECPTISSSMVEGLDNVHSEALDLLERASQESVSNHSRKEDPLIASQPVSSSGEETQSDGNATTEDNPYTLDDGKSQQGSRKSNKKRRRQLKLMRKAAAAAAAAAAISEITRTGTNSSSPGRKNSFAGGGGRLTKRVANIAVACAAQSIANYKAEHFGKGKKAF